VGGGRGRRRLRRRKARRENEARKAKACRGGREEYGQSSQSLGHSQYGSLWCNRNAEAPCFHALGENGDPPANLPSPLPFPAPSQLDSLSPHILCLICQPKPSGPVGRSSGDGSPTSLFSHCISTPADINHGGSILPRIRGPPVPVQSRSILVCEKSARDDRRLPPDFLLQFPLFVCSTRRLVSAGNSYAATSGSLIRGRQIFRAFPRITKRERGTDGTSFPRYGETSFILHGGGGREGREASVSPIFLRNRG